MTAPTAVPTYATLLYQYADGVERGAYDRDLSPIERTYTARLVRTAVADAPWSGVVYPPSDGTRDETVATLQAVAVTIARGVLPEHESAYHAALVRAVEIIRNA